MESISLQPSGSAGTHEGRAANVGDAGNRLLGRQPVRDLDHLALGVAVDQQIGLGIQQDRAAHLVGPVIVMRDAPQRGLDAADDNRYVAISLARPLRVHDHRAVRAPARGAAGGVGIVRADAPVGGVAVDHGIHVAGADAEEQIRPAQGLERFGALPVGLGDDADAETLRLEHAPDDGHAEARQVHVGVAGN